MGGDSLSRRSFVGTAGVAAAGLARGAKSEDGKPFRLAYAPHFGMFNPLSGDDLVDQISFAHDQGFRAWEDNGMPVRAARMQSRIGDALRERGMAMGVFVADAEFNAPTFVLDPPRIRTRLKQSMEQAVVVAQRCGATWMTVVPGRYAQNRDRAYQTSNLIDNLRFCADIVEPHGLVMVLEPLNRQDHPGLFLTGMPQAYQICHAVDRPSCRILDDLYHQQITEGNLLRNLDESWSQVAYIQVGDNPGRREPTTGEIDYRNVFRHLFRKGYDGIVGMEHGVSGRGADGVRRLIEAYRECDEFRE